MYQINSEQFSGPLDLLLSLIEKDELPISEISLAQVTGDYLKYLENVDVPADELADFLTVAARLLLIKSNAILPAPFEETEDPNTLAVQLRLYRAFIEVSKKMEKMYSDSNFLYVRPCVPLPVEPGFHPPENITLNSLVESFKNLIKKFEPFLFLRQASLERVASVEERIRDIQRAIIDRVKFSFSEVISGSKSRSDVIVSFLALLELVRQKIVKVQQEKVFEDIVLTKND